MKNKKIIYNIGYQGKTQQQFIETLVKTGITLLADLREKPYDSVYPLWWKNNYHS